MTPSGDQPPDDLPPDLRAAVLRSNEDLAGWGWCTPRKALALATVILRVRPRCVVEVGVFGGRSLLPQALALKSLGSGTLFGVDPWSNAVAVEVPTATENDAWWAQVDLAKAKDTCLAALRRYQVTDVVRLIERRSRDALSWIAGPIDIAHIDGNHSAEEAARDAVAYCDALAPGGFLWFDDIAWPSTERATTYIRSHCETIGLYCEGDLGSYGLFRKPARGPRGPS